MSDFINRELSWLEFNQRVLDEAKRKELPLLERLKFIAITASNLDEFFQVRVGGLIAVKQSGRRWKDLAGMTPTQQLRVIRARALLQVQEQYEVLEELFQQLKEAGVEHYSLASLNLEQRTTMESYFHDTVFPLLTPLAWDEGADSTALPAMQIILGCKLHSEGQEKLVFIPMPDCLPRFVDVISNKNKGFVMMEDLVEAYVGELFPDEEVTGCVKFRLTRNTDIALEEEDARDLAGEMEEVLTARRFSNMVRVEICKGAPRELQHAIKKAARVGGEALYHVPGPLSLADFMQLATGSGREELCAEEWSPQPSPSLDLSNSLFEQIAQKDVLLHHPYEFFEPVVSLLEEAARDPQTMAIKMVLYRTAKNSAIIDALVKAATNGKYVTVIVELKARFDEARNLERAEELQRAGAQVIYGVKGLKTHAKIMLIMRNEEGRLRRYVHLGTGNYNEGTARLYTDFSYLTARPEYGADASLFFNAVTGRSKLVRLQKIFPAPLHLKQRLLELIESETQRAKAGEKALIMAKMNSLQHPEVIEAFYRASKAGVEVLLNIRGICCLKLGQGNATKNIKVVSIIDRFLEHTRAFYFHRGGKPEVYFSSADLMVRNLDKRVELLVPVEDAEAKKRIISILKSCFRDNTNAHLIQANGASKRVKAQKGEDSFRLQAYLYQRAKQITKARARERATTFEPHRPPD